MHTKQLVFGLILLMQACGPLLAQTVQPDPPGLLQRLTDRAREAKTKVQDVGGTLLGYFDAYYEDHIQPMKDRYFEWTSVWDNFLDTIDDYIPLKFN